MPCYTPLTAWQTDDGDIVFAERGRIHHQLQLPCGQCRGCRLERSRQWAVRCMHEAQMHQQNAFITLTYAPEHLPENGTLHYPDWQRFMKRLRKRFDRSIKPTGRSDEEIQKYVEAKLNKPSLRFYMAGEYGETYGRPHFHACIFGLDFADKKYHATTSTGSKIYTSDTLSQCWKKGFASTADVTFESAAYIARYVMKKKTGDGNKKNYNIINLDTGEIIEKRKEFNNMSRKNGIGKTWYEKYHKDVTVMDKVIVRGHKTRPPTYYDKLLETINPERYDEIKYGREIEAMAHAHDNTPARLKVKAAVAEAKIAHLKRTLD